MKRLFDILLALALLPAALIAVAAAAVAVLACERVLPLFRQTRLGRDERPFGIWKLRTMHLDTEPVGTHEVPPEAVTRTGGFLRRCKLDELPQVLNVLTGDMSFVGPRPGLPTQVELAAERRARGVYAARPGITGMAQVRGVDMSRPVELAELDARYIEVRTLAMDVRILWQTLTGHGFGDRVILERGVPEILATEPAPAPGRPAAAPDRPKVEVHE